MYKLIKNTFTKEIISVQRLSDGAFIPFAPANRDYQEYLEWLAQGNEPEPADEVSE
jgi:hypothetical protein